MSVNVIFHINCDSGIPEPISLRPNMKFSIKNVGNKDFTISQVPDYIKYRGTLPITVSVNSTSSVLTVNEFLQRTTGNNLFEIAFNSITNSSSKELLARRVGRININ